jgi:hypothetical protein
LKKVFFLTKINKPTIPRFIDFSEDNLKTSEEKYIEISDTDTGIEE